MLLFVDLRLVQKPIRQILIKFYQNLYFHNTGGCISHNKCITSYLKNCKNSWGSVKFERNWIKLPFSFNAQQKLLSLFPLILCQNSHCRVIIWKINPYFDIKTHSPFLQKLTLKVWEDIMFLGQNRGRVLTIF